MGVIGYIISMEVDDGQVLARVATGTGQSFTGTLLCPPGVDAYPIPGDSVLCHRVGAEIVFIAGDCDILGTSEGEIRIVSRNSGGVKASIHLKNDGKVVIENGVGEIELSDTGKVTINGHLEVSV